MKTLKIVDDDLVFNNQGVLEMVEGPGEEVQALERTFSTNKGEFFMAPDFGFEYDVLKVKNPRNDMILLAMVDAVTYDARFKRITDLKISKDRSDRKIAISSKIIKTTGETLESEVIL
ncbi:MAG: DUF2634 domain-containing protein [Firmicutes bacterium HGW-Firmicutes-4]|nr:MAG: DUF2634 domain-containing protein [Firmicutes bacterium HGW-Firmicutes-4]